MLDFEEIAKSWIAAAKPTAHQKQLAEKRYTICLGCEYYRKSRPVTHDEYCADCLCPIQKKIFSPKMDACPQHKWLEEEKKSAVVLEKSKKTII